MIKNNWFLLIIASIIVSLLGCVSAKVEHSMDLIVVEQSDSVINQKSEQVTFIVDVPVDGPGALVDSVKALINNELYSACEECVNFEENVRIFKPEEVFTDDSEHLLSCYMKKYRELMQDSMWRTYYDFKMKLEAQTSKYVTYGLEQMHRGGSCGSEKYYYTFDKSDGHLVKDIISRDNLERFFKNYPEYNAIGADHWSGYSGWKYSSEDEFEDTSLALLDDHFSLVITGVGNHYLLADFPYSQIFSYLSPEAQALIERHEEGEPLLPAYLPKHSEDGEVWMEVDTVNYVLLGYIHAGEEAHMDTLAHYEPEMEIYPKRIHSFRASDGSALYLFLYSRGHLAYCDEALICSISDDNHLQPAKLFQVEGQKESVISCMWYDQVVEATEGFPFDEFDENRFGIHYDRYTERLYVPILDDIDKGPEYGKTSCYTGRFEVLHFNGKEFTPAGEDGAWWLNKDLRDYKRTISNRKNADGIEQTDLMTDGTYRRTFWKGAKSLDDLRKKPDELRIDKQ